MTTKRTKTYFVEVTRTYEVLAESMTEALAWAVNDEAPVVAIETRCEEPQEDEQAPKPEERNGSNQPQ